MLRGLRTLGLYPHFGAISHAPRVAYPRFGPSHWSYFACSQGRIPSIWTVTLELFRIIRVSHTFNAYPHIGAISHAQKVAYPRFAPSLWGFFACSAGRAPWICTLTLELCHMLRGLRTLDLYPHFEVIAYAPMATRPQSAPLRWGFFACSEGRVPSSCTLTFPSIPNVVLTMRS